jgi:hypothetical protein
MCFKHTSNGSCKYCKKNDMVLLVMHFADVLQGRSSRRRSRTDNGPAMPQYVKDALAIQDIDQVSCTPATERCCHATKCQSQMMSCQLPGADDANCLEIG